MVGTLLPVPLTVIFEKLTQITADLATYFEKAENEVSKEELYQILGYLAEITYIAGGNGSYLFERGIIQI